MFCIFITCTGYVHYLRCYFMRAYFILPAHVLLCPYEIAPRFYVRSLTSVLLSRANRERKMIIIIGKWQHVANILCIFLQSQDNFMKSCACKKEDVFHVFMKIDYQAYIDKVAKQ